MLLLLDGETDIWSSYLVKIILSSMYTRIAQEINLNGHLRSLERGLWTLHVKKLRQCSIFLPNVVVICALMRQSEKSIASFLLSEIKKRSLEANTKPKIYSGFNRVCFILCGLIRQDKKSIMIKMSEVKKRSLEINEIYRAKY